MLTDKDKDSKTENFKTTVDKANTKNIFEKQKAMSILEMC